MSTWDTYDPTQDQTATTWGQKTDVGEGLKPTDAKIDKLADGTDAFASVLGKGWHNLGTVFNEPVTAEKLLVTAGADYPVYLTSSYGVDDLGQFIEDTRSRKIARDNPQTFEMEILGNASPSYVPVTNREAFVDLGDNVMDVAEPTAATCGVLYGGRQAFMCWRLPKEITVAGQDDTVQLWMTFCHSHDQSLPFTALIAPLRTVCVNTMRYNMRTAVSKWTVKKTTNVKTRMAVVKHSLNLSYEYADEWETAMRKLVETEMTASSFQAIIADQFAPGEDATPNAATLWTKKQEKLFDNFTQERDRVGSNAWAALNAVDSYYTWQTSVDVKAATRNGFDSIDGYRQWRAVTNEKSVTDSREGTFKRLMAMAGA